jgi:hypothetical protein
VKLAAFSIWPIRFSAARKVKPIWAVANDEAFSAAYVIDGEFTFLWLEPVHECGKISANIGRIRRLHDIPIKAHG